jgi:hypothetical protein
MFYITKRVSDRIFAMATIRGITMI